MKAGNLYMHTWIGLEREHKNRLAGSNKPGLKLKHPLQRFARDLGRKLVSSVEFLEGDVVAHRAEPRHHDAAALIDRQDLIGRAVREEQPRFAVCRRLDDEPRRAGHDTRKQIPVNETER